METGIMTTLTSSSSFAETEAPRSRRHDPRPLPTFFLAGCQKTASTWLYCCFQEHPDILVPPTDAVQYFTMNYHRGLDWYRRHFNAYQGEVEVCDPTPSYIRDLQAARRIADFNPDARLIFSLRNPVERAFSHYWHEKKKHKIAFEFEEVLDNFDLYHNWIASGFYAELLKPFYDHFPAEQIKVVLYDDLKSDARAFLRSILEFLEVDPDFEPSVIDRKMNKAYYRPTQHDLSRIQRMDRLLEPARRILPASIKSCLRQRFLGGRYTNQVVSEYERGMDPQVRRRLQDVLAPENEKLARLIGRDLSHWT